MNAELQDLLNMYAATLAALKKKADEGGGKIGVIYGGKVWIDGQSYSYDTTTPDYLPDGRPVAAMLTDTGRAVVLG